MDQRTQMVFEALDVERSVGELLFVRPQLKAAGRDAVESAIDDLRQQGLIEPVPGAGRRWRWSEAGLEFVADRSNWRLTVESVDLDQEPPLIVAAGSAAVQAQDWFYDGDSAGGRIIEVARSEDESVTVRAAINGPLVSGAVISRWIPVAGGAAANSTPPPAPDRKMPVTDHMRALKEQLDELVTHMETEHEDHPEAQRATGAAFAGAGVELLASATPYLWEYYDSERAKYTDEARIVWGFPVIDADADIWTYVSFRHPPEATAGTPPLEPAEWYLSFEGNVAWEPEHGLQLVFADGGKIEKVGPYDGHVTNAYACADESLLGVVFHR